MSEGVYSLFPGDQKKKQVKNPKDQIKKKQRQRSTKTVKKNAFSHLYPAVRSYGTWPPSTFQGRTCCAAKQKLF